MKMGRGRTREREGEERNTLLKTEAINKRKKGEKDLVSENNETSP